MREYLNFYIAGETAEAWPPGDPKAGGRMGPVISNFPQRQRTVRRGEYP